MVKKKDIPFYLTCFIVGVSAPHTFNYGVEHPWRAILILSGVLLIYALIVYSRTLSKQGLDEEQKSEEETESENYATGEGTRRAIDEEFMRVADNTLGQLAALAEASGRSEPHSAIGPTGPVGHPNYSGLVPLQGSVSARELGCICPHPNAAGIGQTLPNPSCPIHGSKEPEPKPEPEPEPEKDLWDHLRG